MKAMSSALLFVILLLVVSSVEADHPTTRTNTGSLLLWQAQCDDGRVTPVHVADDSYIHERTAEPDSSGNFASPGSPPAPEGAYNTPLADEFCLPGDVVAARGTWKGTYQDMGWYRSDTTPPYPDVEVGPDATTCLCLGKQATACFDGTLNTEAEACAQQCALQFGRIKSGQTSVRRLSPECANVGPPADRGPECHCFDAGNVPDPSPFCVNAADCAPFCEDRHPGGGVHHTAPGSTRCVQVEGCLLPGTATAALAHLRAAVGLVHVCVDSLL